MDDRLSPSRPIRVPASAGPPPATSQRTRVKICGITNLDDAEQAVSAGAWAIGLILWRGSKRRCRFEQAQLIGTRMKRRVEVAGVFVNATLDEVDQAVDACGLTLVQLHGDEGPAYCAEVARRTGARVIKAARVRVAADVTALRPYRTDFHLLDTHVAGTPGGTGQTFDWSLARGRRASRGVRQPPLILSGGLTPENVAEAVAAVHPFAVDVASGVEAAPGRKDHERVSAFIQQARSVWDEVDEAREARLVAASRAAAAAAAEPPPAASPSSDPTPPRR